MNVNVRSMYLMIKAFLPKVILSFSCLGLSTLCYFILFIQLYNKYAVLMHFKMWFIPVRVKLNF
uniref:Uncharacterized protein n=1 Tax=Cyprinus carpio TaxID=7962 RepID=A0A8C1UZR8_CYPCA